MTKMTETELLSFLGSAEADAVSYNASFVRENETLFSYYMGEPLGDEEEGKSKVVSTDVFDLVEADMPSLVRSFLGSNDILEFQPHGEADAEEAEQKTKYINWLVRRQPTSFKTIHDWMKDAEIQKVGVVKFYIDDQKTTEEREYKGLSDIELTDLMGQLEESPKVTNVKIVSRQDSEVGYHVTFRITKRSKKVVIDTVPVDSFLISRNAKSKDSASLVGDRTQKTRGMLLAEGYSRKLIESLPRMAMDPSGSRMKQMRFPDQATIENPSDGEWANEWVELKELYVLCDWDGDGIAERRRIVKSGNVILENKPFGIVPYALLSAIAMPHSAIGRSRAEIAKPTQYLKTHLNRQILNNIYQVNAPRTAVNDENVELDDLLTHKVGGLVRVDGNPIENLMPLVTPYIGTQALEIVQYIDFSRAQSTGSLMASQGLSIDDLHKETATRFEGIEDASQAKIELVARVFSETGFRELYEGLAWLTAHYQDEVTEIEVLGEPLKIDPRQWKYDHHCASDVGLAAGDSEELLANLGTLYQAQVGLKAAQSPLVDDKKLYNTLSKIIKAMGQARVSDYINNPERPQQLLLAENEQLKALITALQGQMQNPLAEAERIKAEAKILVDGAKQDGQMAIEEAKQRTSMNEFLLKMAQQQDEFMKTMALKLTELELKFQQGSQEQTEDIPGSLV